MTRVADLGGAELALWVARAQKLDVRSNALASWVWDAGFPNGIATYITGNYSPRYVPHEDWAQGGPLLEKHWILLAKGHADPHVGIPYAYWSARVAGDGKLKMSGPTPLIASMRALVASVFGDTVPDEAQS